MSDRKEIAVEAMKSLIIAKSYSSSNPSEVVDDAIQYADLMIEKLADAIVTPPAAPVPDASGNTMTVTNPTSVLGFKKEGNEYVRHFGSTSDNQQCSLDFALPELPDGTEFDVTFRRAANYAWEGNQKIFRVWNKKIGSYPNWYAGLQKDGSTVLYTEKLPPVSARRAPTTGEWLPWTRAYFTYPPPTGMYREERWQWKTSSSVGKADGWVRVTIADRVVLEADKWQSSDSGNPGVANVICLQDVPANLTSDLGATAVSRRSGKWVRIQADTLSIKIIKP